MQNKAFISFIAIVVALACLYHLSFTVITKKVESDAAAYANGDPGLEKAYLDSLTNTPLDLGEGTFGRTWRGFVNQFSYQNAKQRELNLGLDLKGGMNLTIEVSVADLLYVMANKTEDPAFNNALKAAREQSARNGSDLINNFVAAAKQSDPNVQFSSARWFGHSNQSAIKSGMTNDEVIAILRKEADQAIDRTYEVLNSRIDQFGVTQPNIQKLEATGRILIELPGIKDPERAVELVQKTAKLEFWETVNMSEVAQTYVKIDEYLAKIKKAEKAAGISTEVIDSTAAAANVASADSGVAKTNLALAANGDSADADTAGGKPGLGQKTNPDDSPLFSILKMNIYQDPTTQQLSYGYGSLLGHVLPADTAKFNQYMRIPQVAAMAPKNMKLVWGYKAEPYFKDSPAMVPVYCISAPGKGRPVLEGDVVTNADYEKNPDGGGFMVRMYMNSDGADKWAKITEANSPKGQGTPGKSIAIVLDGKVYSAPTVQNKITGGVSSITGSFTFEEAKALAAVLKSGKLPVPATIVEKAVVGPTMGSQAINSGLIAMSIAFVFVLVFMAVYYAQAGWIANLALLCSLFFQVGTLASLGTTLTLPGIAGIVLSFAMSVDSNVLIFERIREELRAGKGLRLAVSEGFTNAYSSIIDGNMTAIITAIILMFFGAGPTKGFAVTLLVGNLSSIFAAIFITRLVFEARLNKKKTITFSYPFSENPFKRININFIKLRKVFYVIAAAVVLAGAISYSIKGFNLGVDLQGGRTYTVALDNPDFDSQAVADELQKKFDNEPPVVKKFGTNDRIKIITKYRYNESTPEAETAVEKDIYDALLPFYKEKPSLQEFSDQLSGKGIIRMEKVGPTIAGSTKTKSLYAVGISLVLIFLYILARFRGWWYGFSFFAAVAFDVLVVLTFYTIFDGILPFSLEIDQSIIAAILTVIGYCLNDTVVVFDRVREYMGEKRKITLENLFNSALNDTLSRTVITSGMTILVLVIVFALGGTGLKSMSFSLLVGISTGTISSVFFASPLVMDLMKRFPKKDTKVVESTSEVTSESSKI